jgi:hypothetical protein
MTAKAKTDDNNVPQMQADGVTPRMQTYFAFAVPKGPEQSFTATPWGAQVAAEALASWPNGETGAPTFSWKITDGDSQVPNRNGKKPCDTEGFPGHWIVRVSTELNGPRCFHFGKYQPHEQIKTAGTIKCGDYCRLVINVKGNGAVGTQVPGIYVNPDIFELYRAGVEIVSESGADPMATLGATAAAAVLPAGAAVDPTAAAGAAAAASAEPVPGFSAGPQPGADVAPPPAPEQSAPPAPVVSAEVAKRITANGAQYTEEQLRAAAWQEPQIQALPLALRESDVPY